MFVAFKASSEDLLRWDRGLDSQKPRQVSGPTSDLVLDTEVGGLVLRGVRTILHSPKPVKRQTFST